jgi:hypothetical protein
MVQERARQRAATMTGLPERSESAPPSLRALSCPRCGGAIEMHEGAPLLRCAYCRGTFLARVPGGTFRSIAPARIPPRQAEASVRDLFADERCPDDLRAEATRISCELLYVPFWRFRSTFVGRARGLKDIVSKRPIRTYRGDENGSGAAVIEMQEIRVGQEEVDEEIQEIWRVTISACPLHDLGVPQLTSKRQMPGALAAFSAGAGEIEGLALLGNEPGEVAPLDPMVPAEAARREARLVFDRFAKGRGTELREKEIVFEELQQRESLLYYPIYHVRFAYQGRIYRATIEGLDGRVVHAVLPARRAGGLLPLTLAAAGGGWMAGTLARAIASPPALFPEMGSLPLHPAFWVAVGAAALGWGWLVSQLLRLARAAPEDFVVAA